MARKFFKISGYLKSHGGSKEFDDRHVYSDLRFVENGSNQLRKVDTALVPPALTGYVDPNAGATEFYFSGKPFRAALVAVKHDGILIEDYEKVGLHVAAHRFFDRCLAFGFPIAVGIAALGDGGAVFGGGMLMVLLILGILRTLTGSLGESIGLATTKEAQEWLATQQE